LAAHSKALSLLSRVQLSKQTNDEGF